MNRLNLFLFGLIAFSGILSIANGKIINCYYGAWAHYRQGDGAFRVDHIDPNLCTHLSYSFYGINPTTGEVKTLDDNLTNDAAVGQIAQLRKLKAKNPNFKIMLVVGGWNECETNKYSRMAASPSMRKTFVQSAVKLIKDNGFDGFDLDWEYPVTRAGTPADKANFVTLLGDLKAALKPLGKELGIAVSAGIGTARDAYDIPGISKNVDFINVMTYDFSSHWGGSAGLNAPLEGQGQNNIKSAIKYWRDNGAPANKLLLGLPFYGQTYKLASPNNYKLGAQTAGPLPGGPYTQQNGFLGYHEICQRKNSYNYEWLSEHSVPILHKASDYISFDNVKSLENKVDFANSEGLGGVMIWSIETDDFHGKCGDGKFPLLTAINKKIANPKGPSLAKEEEGQSQVPTVQEDNEPSYVPEAPAYVESGGCSDRLQAHPTDCGMFIQCAHNVPYEKYCPAGLHFDEGAQACNYPEQVNCQH